MDRDINLVGKVIINTQYARTIIYIYIYVCVCVRARACVCVCVCSYGDKLSSLSAYINVYLFFTRGCIYKFTTKIFEYTPA